MVIHLKEATAEAKAWRVIDSLRQPVIAYSSFRVYEADHKDSTINVFTRLRFPLPSFIPPKQKSSWKRWSVCATEHCTVPEHCDTTKGEKKIEFQNFFKVQELGNKILVLKGLV